MRSGGRPPDEMRPVRLERGFTHQAEGSVLASFGETRVLCTASVENRVPPFLVRGTSGWIHAEYAMLPRATPQRNPRDSTRGGPGGRTQEIQRLIARSLRAAVDLEALGKRQVVVDCDVLQADGGTRTAAITGGYVALRDALETLVAEGIFARAPLHFAVAAVSAAVVDDNPLLDPDYQEDARAAVDMNFVLADDGRLVEVQGTAEQKPFTDSQMEAMRGLARTGAGELFRAQERARSEGGR